MSLLGLENAVANHPFLEGMNPAHLRILAESAMFTRFEAGQVVFHEGEIANRFYLLQSGQVSVETRGGAQQVISIQMLGPGDILGWSWLFAPYYWHFSACAVESTQAIFFYGTRLREICEQDREFGFELMRRVTGVLMRRLQMTLRESLRLANRPSGDPEAGLA
jgi:CRP/FNR family transcriptional regulator, cyclic AMP receptor protein